MNARAILLIAFVVHQLAGLSLRAGEFRGKVLTYGLIKRTAQEKVVPTPETSSGATRIPNDFPTFASITNRVPAKIGAAFGMVYEVSGLTAKDGEEVEIVKAVTHPPMTKPDGSISKGFWFVERIPVKNGRVWAFTGYSFDHSYELVSGPWHFEMHYQGKPVVRQDFIVDRGD